MIIMIILIKIIMIIIVKANRPDKDKKERRCKLIDIAVPSESNTSAKFTEKFSNYKDLEI